MISVSDARKGLELSLGGGGRADMEESELEEGEACSYQSNQDYDHSMDPDVALSYFDEKIHVLLGHFQKDFEGGVSAENLGAKFGGYGSFLPTYQRSPAWSQPRTPPKVHSQNMSRSPNNLRLEGGQGDSVDYSTATQSLRLEPSSVNSSRPLAAKLPTTDGAINQEKCFTPTCADAFTSKYESVNTKSSSMTDQKTLKVRIKMGTDNLSTQKNAAIYSGLGLDVSPSSSLDDSPSGSEEISRGHHDVSVESPSSILQIMSSLPMQLSPLSNDILQFAGEETCAKNGIHVPVCVDGSECAGMLQLDSDIIKGDTKRLGRKKMKSVDGNGSSIEVKAGTNESARMDIGISSKKEQFIDSLTTEELVSKTLKLPLLSSSYSSSEESLKDVGGPCDTSKEPNKDTVLEKAFCSEQAQMERVNPTSIEANGFVPKMKGGSGRKISGDKAGKSLDNSSVYAVQDNFHGDDIPKSIRAESIVDRGRTDLSIEHTDPPKKTSRKGNFCEQDSTALHVTEHPFPGEKKKSKGSNQSMAAESNNESSMNGTSMSKAKKRIDGISMSNNETEDARLKKDHGKAKDRYKDFFGDLEDDEDRVDSLETFHEDKPNEYEVVKRSTPLINSGVKERSGVKKFDKPFVSEAYPPTAQNLVRYSGNGHASTNGNGVPVTVPPVVIEENWVQCDKCQKWRLLPLGTNPESLPEKWLCSMLNWLPDMNRCSVSEDETTKALVASLQGPPPEGQSIPGSVLVGGTPSAVQYPKPNQPNHGLNAMPGEKKRTVKEISNSAIKDGLQLLSSTKKNTQSSMKSRSLSDMNKSPATSEPDVRGEKHKTKQKKQESYSDIGDTKNFKVKSCKDAYQDYSRQSKKSKTDNMHFADQQWVPDPSGATRKFHHSLSSSSPTTAAGKELPKHKDHSSLGDSKYDGKDRLQVSAGKLKDKGWSSLDDEYLDLRNHGIIDSVKKRKLKEYQDLGHYHQQESKISVQEDFSRKEKKIRLSKSDGRESSISRGSSKTDKKVSREKHKKIRKDPGSTLSQQSLDGTDNVKKDSRSVQVSAAATSSSSKVSGSHKTKASFQEVKGSPVESVSSSPFRSLNTEKLTSGELMGKYNTHDTDAIGSPTRCFDGEDDGGSDRFGTTRKDKSSVAAHHASHGPSMLNFQNKEVDNVLDGKSKAQKLPSPDITTNLFTNGGVDTVDQYRKYSSSEQVKDQCQGEDRNGVYCANTMSNPRKTGQGSSSRLKDDSLSCKLESAAEMVKKTSQMLDQPPLSEMKYGDGKVELQDKLLLKPDRRENIIPGKKDCARNAGRLKNNQLDREHDIVDTTLDVICKPEQPPAFGQNLLPDCDDERYSKRSLSERTDQEVFSKGKSISLPPSGGGAQTETSCHGTQPVVELHQGNGDMVVDNVKVDSAPKLQKKQVRKADNQNGTQPLGLKHSMLNGHKSKELDAPSPIRREYSSHAANNALKEAKDLKHLADRLKNNGSSLETTGLYFQAALKFLHGASLLESGNNDSAKYSEMNQAKQVYSSTAKLCEFCAHEFEKLKDMGAAALAYKCMEVAYMRVIFSSHTSASRDRHELQTTLQSVPLGESPSSSASDVDNANNSTAADKIALSKGVSPSQVVGTHVIAARNRPNLMRLLNFAQDVNSAMEASRKSRLAFAAANSTSCEGKHAEGISPIKKALDFNFQDVKGFLRLVRLAMEAINR